MVAQCGSLSVKQSRNRVLGSGLEADDAVPVGQREFASGLVHRSLRPLALPPVSCVAGRFAPLGVLRPKLLRGKARCPLGGSFVIMAWTPICFLLPF
jgi:hypothetical protein